MTGASSPSESLDVSALAPSDAVVALRSYPRRYLGVVNALEPDEELPADAVAHFAEAGRTIALLREAVSKVLTGEAPMLPAGVVDEQQRSFTMPPDEDVSRALEVLTAEAEGLASEADGVPADDWRRTGQVTGGGEVSALDLLREAVRAGHRHLRAAEQAASRSSGR